MVDSAPELIRTDRLVLRKVVDGDLPVMVEIHGDPAANVFRPDRARSVDESVELFRIWLRDWAEHGIGYWAVEAVEVAPAGGIIGFGGLRVTVRDGERLLNLYYRFRPSAWGKGFASEMAAAAVAWAERAWPDHPVEIMTTTDNAPSRRVAEKLGFSIVRSVRRDGFTDVHMRRVGNRR
ncbi:MULTISPECIES: GNAT family N-acetyltransferase [unclassified Nocardia]|uniref:GNAT family N-acetyltransferase n=1 Tax=unclassified Nocardia TaxID=2637762 RepID=UPI001CE3F94A|nr:MULTISPECIES: GNAT family N-acetyltransferase [unclassified Nocardia]